MAEYNFERLSILLVEDNIYIRDMLEQVLKQLGFGWVAKAGNGQEAVEFLTLVKKNPHAAGVMAVDMILCDLVMSPINGLLLLRWVRASKDSPNRMMPFVMISGAADNDHVRASRDMGVSEFCAKPFTVQNVMQRLLTVIDYPRQFVTTHNYFGPDRRRRQVIADVPPDKDRRRLGDKGATIVYSADKVVKPKTATDVWYFRLPNRLKEKAGGGGAKGPGTLPTALIEQAEQQLEKNSLDFADWATTYLSKLSQLVTDALMTPANRKRYFEQINLVGHELRGQGGTFGYPLITILGKSLYEATLPGNPQTDASLELVKSHIDAMKAVIRERISGDGGKVGQALLASFKEAVERHKKESETVE